MTVTKICCGRVLGSTDIHHFVTTGMKRTAGGKINHIGWLSLDRKEFSIMSLVKTRNGLNQTECIRM